ncbi:hypothetical protein HJC23_000887 [Cyclotella cryptica]|uniref:Uncharacterized protein n=1 Tax=Cyclotella cryptica TaxID=29204 RepID=A0ABD3PTB3_9STRA|eukprot:CCRYP_011613-RB/>CCRYP_011613-RB protein AED:0.03 eAED:0.03 QI:125/1/1/1/0.33/0.25/4/3015/724
MRRTALSLSCWRLTRLLHVYVLPQKYTLATLSRQTGGEVHTIRTQRNVQDSCVAPSNGCGAGLWDQSSCRCLCITNYCYDEMFGSCATYGSCPSDFASCTPKVNCPYYPNPATGTCDTGSETIAGVYEIFWTQEECCNKVYAWDPSSCITETKSPTFRPTASTSPSTAPPVLSQQPGLVLPQISIQMINIPDVEMSNVQSSKVKDVIRDISEEIIEIFNVTIEAVDIVDAVYSQGRTLVRVRAMSKMRDFQRKHEVERLQQWSKLNDSDKLRQRGLADILTLLIEIIVSETTVSADEIRSSILHALQSRKYDIDQVLRDTLGPEIYTGVILQIDGDETTIAPSPTPSSYPAEKTSSALFVQGNNGNAGETDNTASHNTLALVLIILFGILFAFVCCGLIVWQRKRDFYKHKLTTPGFNMLTLKHKKHHRRRKRHRSKRHMHVSEKTLKLTNGEPKTKLNVSESTLKIANRAYIDEEQKRMDDRLMLGYSPNHVSYMDELDKGYEGGKSSFFESQGGNSNNSLNASSGLRIGIDPEEASRGDSVLGLLYYEGASSAEEDENPGSKSDQYSRMRSRSSKASSVKSHASSRRSRRQSTLGKSKSSMSRSSKSKSSRSQRSRKSRPALMNQVDESEEFEYHREDGFNDQHECRDEPLQQHNLRSPQLQPTTKAPSVPAAPHYSSCSSVSTNSVEVDYTMFSRLKSVGTALTDDKSLSVNSKGEYDLFS